MAGPLIRGRSLLGIEVPSAGLVQLGAQFGYGRGVEQRPQGQVHAERPADPRDDLPREQGMPTQGEEVVVDPYAIEREDLGPNGGDRGLGDVRGAAYPFAVST